MHQLSGIFAVTILVAASFYNKANCSTIKTNWIEQKLDHFCKNGSNTWQMRYFTNDKFHEPNGPIFIFVGGEWAASSEAIDYGFFIYELAKLYKGYLVCTEHRYYGESKPVDEMTLGNLKYLESQQALADLAHVIKTLKDSFEGVKNSKVILVGCSYSGALATWFKKLYPKLANGVWASSAPLLAKADNKEFKELLGQALKKEGGEDCHDSIKNGISKLESMFDNKKGKELQELLKISEPLNNSIFDAGSLFYQISESFAKLLDKPPYKKIKDACATIMKESSDVKGVAKYFVETFGYSNHASYASYLKHFTDTSFRKQNLRQWFYQLCNEFGWFQTSTSTKNIFGSKFPVNFFYSICKDVYGETFTQKYIETKIAQTNKNYGGLNPDLKNIYFTHGALDPWRNLGNQNPRMSTIIPDTSHASDLFYIGIDDPPEMIASKEKLMYRVGEWLA